MPTTADYLNDLVAQKNSLKKTLADNGVEVSENETFSTLVPKANKKIMYSGEDNPLLTKLMNDEAFDFYDDTVTEWKSPILALSRVKSISLPNCTTIGFRRTTTGDPSGTHSGVFHGCGGLYTINLPKCKTIKGNTYGTEVTSGTFSSTSITKIVLPECTEILGTCAFRNCLFLTKVDMPKLTTIGVMVNPNKNTECYGCATFYGCAKLTEVNLPELTFWAKNSDTHPSDWVHYQQFFYGCSSLQQISLPKARIIPCSTFDNCTKLASVHLPLVEVVGANGFRGCTSLIQLELPSCTRVRKDGFSMKNLTELTLSSSGATMQFHNTAFTNATSLKTIIFDGVLVSDGTDASKLNFSKNPLDLDTAKRIINCLENYAGTENEYAYTVTFSSTTLNLLNAEGATAPGDITWVAYADSKGWNI